MLSICNICLRTNIKLKISEDSLRNFHDELCDFEVDGYARYCLKCLYLLRKFYNFRNKCIKANILLKTWEKYNKLPRHKVQDLDKLHEKLPTSLGLSHDDSHTIFSYTSQAENVADDTENNIDNSLTTDNNAGDDLFLKPGFIILDSSCPIYNRDVCSIFIDKTENYLEENDDTDSEYNINETYSCMNIPLDSITCETTLETNDKKAKCTKVNKSVNRTNVKSTTKSNTNKLISNTNESDASSSKNMSKDLFPHKPKGEKDVEDKYVEKNKLPEEIKATVTIKFVEDNDMQYDLGFEGKELIIEQSNIDHRNCGDVDVALNYGDLIDRDMKIKKEKEIQTKKHTDVYDDHDDNDDVLNLDDMNDNDQDINIKNEVIKRIDDADIDKIIEEALRSDSSDDEVLQIKCQKTMSSNKENHLKKKEVARKRKSKDIERELELIEEEPKEKKPRRKPSTKRNLEETVRNVKRRLGNGEVIDKEGNVIDADIILSNLDTMVEYTYCKIKKYCAGNDPLTPEAIEYLGRTQKRYSKEKQYSSVFITKHVTTDEEIMEEFRKRETSKAYLQCEHKCTRCFRHFKSAKMLKLHIKEYHDANKPHKCRYCDMRFDRLQPLYRHVQTHRVVYQCKLCPLVTNYITVMKSHYNYHKGVRYPCTKCDAVFKTPPVLAAHMNYVHQTDHICECCARRFYSKQGLLQHKLKKHQDDLDTVGPPSAKCEQCDLQFISDEVYQEHQFNSHSGPRKRKLIAGVDKSKKKRKPTLNRRTPRFTCRLCKAVESSIGALIWHFKSQHPTEDVEIKDMALRPPYQYLCHQCGKEFNNITTLTDHKNVHTGVRPYACTECPKAFYYRTHLRNHMPFHLPPTKLCPHCGKAFRSNSNLCNHLRQHTGERRYSCNMCGKTFLHQSAVSAHVRGVHLHIRRKRTPAKQHPSSSSSRVPHY